MLSRKCCIYCNKVATTRDHVPPKLLLEKPFPPNLQTVRSCQHCNQNASLDEQYFLVLLGQISLSPNITAKIADGGVIDRTLSHSPALEESLLQALGIDEETGMPFIRPEIERINRVIKKIAIGLFALRYGRVLIAETIDHVSSYPYQLRDDRPAPYFINTFTERFKSKQWRTIQSGIFSYIFIRDPNHSGKLWCVMDIHQTIWGVVHFPNPKSITKRNNQQHSLF